MRLLPGEADVVQILCVALALDLHEKAVGIGATLILQDSKGLPTLGFSLVNNVHLIWGMLFEKIT